MSSLHGKKEEDEAYVLPSTAWQGSGIRKSQSHLTALPQAVVGMQRCNFNTWVKDIGGILNKAGTFMVEQHYIMIGAGLGNLFLAAHLLLAGAKVTLLEASSKIGGRAEQCITQGGGEGTAWYDALWARASLMGVFDAGV